MRQQRTYGSVRGAISDGRPYRDQRFCYQNATASASLLSRHA